MNPWLLAARPKTLLASWSPVGIGTALAYHDEGLHLPAAIACLVGATAVQIGTNYCNDYFDFRQGADTADRKGPTRAVAAGLISPTRMLWGTCLMFGLALIVGCYLTRRAGWPLLLIALVSVGCGVWYTAGRYALAYLGWAEAFVIFFFGPLAVAATHYVQTLHLSWGAAMLGLGPGLISCGLLSVNNLRDMDEDRAAGKRTLAVRFGVDFPRWEYATCLALAALVPVVAWRQWGLPPAVLAASLVAGLAGPVARDLWRLQGAELNSMLGRTAAIHLLYGLALCLGLVW